MTRINVVPVEELSDQWLRAEYRELPRCIKQNINTDNAPKKYCLGKGHMKWAKHHTIFLLVRYRDICAEMEYRGYKCSFSPYSLFELSFYSVKKKDDNCYLVLDDDIELNRQRLIERYRENPKAHRWTKRNKPEWLQ